jgi:uncharacterized membrane protein YgcG
MTDDKNDMIPGNMENKLPASLDEHLRAVIREKTLEEFRQQLPVEFLSDATEGLNQVKDGKQLESVLHQLNQQMHHHLEHKKIRKRKNAIGDLSWTYWTIVIVFLLIVVGFILIRMILQKS